MQIVFHAIKHFHTDLLVRHLTTAETQRDFGFITLFEKANQAKLGQHYLAALNEAFPGVVLDHAWQTKDQLTVTVKVNYLPEVVEFLYYKQGGWLSVLFGNDERKLNGHYAVYYVLSMEKGTKCWITVRVEVDANKPEYPSVTPRVPAAVWGEREVRDMYGLIPVGLPDERRLVLPDDWPDELYPLRKDSMDYRQRPAPTTDAETYEFINEYHRCAGRWRI